MHAYDLTNELKTFILDDHIHWSNRVCATFWLKLSKDVQVFKRGDSTDSTLVTEFKIVKKFWRTLCPVLKISKFDGSSRESESR